MLYKNGIVTAVFRWKRRRENIAHFKNIVNETKMWFWPQSNVIPQNCYCNSSENDDVDDNKTTSSMCNGRRQFNGNKRRRNEKSKPHQKRTVRMATGCTIIMEHQSISLNRFVIEIIVVFIRVIPSLYLSLSVLRSNKESVVFCLPFPNGDECACIPIKNTGWRMKRKKKQTNTVVVSCLKIAKKHFICLTSCMYVWVCTIKVVRYLPTDKSINFPAHWRNVCLCVHCALLNSNNNLKFGRSRLLSIALFANCTLKDIRNEMRSEDKMSICRQNCKHYLPRFHSIWTIFMVKCIR